MMLSPLDTLAISLAHSTSPDATNSWLYEIDGMEEEARRNAHLLHELAIRRPDLAAEMLGCVVDLSTEVIATRGESVVYKLGDTVAKVNIDSVSMSEPERQHLAEKKISQFGKVEKYLGKFLVDQEIEVGPHPLVNKARAVITRQAFYDLENIGIFIDGGELNGPNIDDAILRFPYLHDQLEEFTDCSLELYKETGLLPDTYAGDNVFLVQDPAMSRLVIIDSQPLTPGDSDKQLVVLGQMHELRRILQTC